MGAFQIKAVIVYNYEQIDKRIIIRVIINLI